ncbi:lipopolysaccharide biosynthesis protein [Erythrobacter sp. WG]|uniref:lipopolysaccharide biosynthesis protein n=1 Tax=Erythrobacter sp. WG TaxID=2985510 RepID=UPI00226E7027|nr:lipopolysaccharide biosynthesis protein [Erythrobacter sp. WG]MCX9148853.1 lipopolysaccharide biosynthesis protein [Erythrobacter sp. WG]
MADAPDTGPAAPSLASQVRTAVIWRSGSQIGTQIVSWASTLIVIRLLAPQDYGLFAMAQVMLTLLATMNGWGLASALIREAEVSEQRLRQALGMLMLLNGGLALIQFLTAPLVALWFGQPLVADLLRVQSLIYLTVPFCALPYAMLSRRMDFRRTAQVKLVSAVAGAGTALVGAFGGWGVWTLVCAPLVMYVTEAIGMTRAACAPIRPSFRFEGAGHIAGFGGVMTATQLFWFVQSQSDVMIAGRVLDPHDLGVYTTGLFLAQLLAAKFVPPINEVAFAAYSRQQASLEGDSGAGALLATIRLVMLVALPGYAGMAAVAPVLVPVVLGEQWHEIVPLLPIFCLAMAMMTLQILFAPATNARGVPFAALRITMIGSVVMSSAFFVGSHWGLEGFAWGWVGGMAVLTCATVVLSGGIIGLRLDGLARALVPPLAAALVMAALVRGVLDLLPPGLLPLAALAVCVLIGIGLYLGLLKLIAPDRIAEALRFIRNRGDGDGEGEAAMPAPAE